MRRDDDFFSDYQRLATIDQKLQDIAANNTIATYVPSIGTSHLGNSMPALVIDAGTATNKWNAYIGGGIHAREWISPATAMYIANYFTSQYGVDPELTSLLEKVTFHIVPVQNPDGSCCAPISARAAVQGVCCEIEHSKQTSLGVYARSVILKCPHLKCTGYEFSHTNSRLWRKNRRDNGNNQYGVDLNRNFDWQYVRLQPPR